MRYESSEEDTWLNLLCRTRWVLQSHISVVRTVLATLPIKKSLTLDSAELLAGSH